ncbi:MAG: hypothetical protein HUU19_15225 [Phycisphaerales bacterium]|nr:hypothetical protein [Phycisphaerales bacterium]
MSKTAVNTLDVLYAVGGVISAPFWARKQRGGWSERFGNTPALPAPHRPRVLLHAVSVGEVNALRQVVPVLAASCEVVVCATTDTGLKRATDLFSANHAVVRYPLDFSRSVAKFLDAVRPDAVGLVELEVWPNFVGACVARGIPVGVINGRLSARSFKGYRRIRGVIGRTFRALSFAAVQDADYAERFLAMGVPKDRLSITGSMKWDAARIEDGVAGADDLARALKIDRTRPLIVAGSTGPGEEELLYAACPAGVQLLCAPRKPERFEDAATAMPGCVRRSKPGSGRPESGRFLLDSIGELRQAYSLATLVVVGRSFGDQYGSDPIEPIALGRPTLIGPAVSDFANIVREFESAGGIGRTDRGTLARDLARWIGDPEGRSRLAEAGRACIRTNQGASARHADLLAEWAVRAAAARSGLGGAAQSGAC